MIRKIWIKFWMRWAGLSAFGRLATRLATIFAPPHKAGLYLASVSRQGYIAPTATIYHNDLRLGDHLFIGDRVILYQGNEGGALTIGENAVVLRDCILETAKGGSLVIEDGAAIHPRCQVNAYLASIRIGKGVMIAPSCALYSYSHGTDRGKRIATQPLTSKGDIDIGDDSWLGVGVIVLSGVRIGRGAVIGAGSVVTGDIPEEAIAHGVPARVVGRRRRKGDEDSAKTQNEETINPAELLKERRP